MTNQIDHFAVAAASLEQGTDAMKSLLGVTIPQGGKHDLMSTHNCVMQAGNDSFFELIAIDPDAPPPSRTRWFTLDETDTQSRISERPRALCWVVNTSNLDEIVAKSPVDLGEVVTFTRGDRSWRLTVPEDGHLPGNGLLPAFIEWSPGPHPSAAQKDLRVRLIRIKLSHPDPDTLAEQLATLGVLHLAEIDQGEIGLSFELRTPKGNVTID